jgi:hypothetical protein
MSRRELTRNIIARKNVDRCGFRLDQPHADNPLSPGPSAALQPLMRTNREKQFPWRQP